MQDWDTRINNLKSDIQAAREKYVIPFMKAQPKIVPAQKEVSQTLHQILKKIKLNPQSKLLLKNYMRIRIHLLR